MASMLDQSKSATAGGVDPMVPRVVRVARRRVDAPEIVTLEIDIEDGFDFTPGQFNMLTAFGVGEVAISISGDPVNRGKLVHTIRDVGPISGALTRLKPGQSLGLRGPFGVGWPMAESIGRDVVILAGGLGLAPLRPAIYRVLAERERYGKVAILYGTRSPGDILFHREIESWRRRLDATVEVTVDHGTQDWHGHVGVVTKLVRRSDFDSATALAMVCGPEVMMRFGAAALREAGMPDEAIYVSMERNMKCAVGFCGHCQFGPVFVCKDGPVFSHDRIRHILALKEI
jgi:NAD(P)H-flavin reductase